MAEHSPVVSKRKAAYGDFQTPPELAAAVARKLLALFGRPRNVVEPTCGVGRFLSAAFELFGPSTSLYGAELNPDYADEARRALPPNGARRHAVVAANFFHVDWARILVQKRGSTLVLGNPPWVTTATLGALGALNLPPKGNGQRFRGLDALTGKSNFDISEAMCLRLLTAAQGHPVWFGLLVKSAVARRTLEHAWSRGLLLRDPRMYDIDAKTHFGAAVEACLFVGRTDGAGVRRCPVFAHLDAARPRATVGYSGSALVSDSAAFSRTKHLAANGAGPQWRSGIKHDAANIFELRRSNDGFLNGDGKRVDVEPDVLFPMLKSSHVASRRADPARWMIVPQRHIRDSTEALLSTRPKLRRYLETNGQRLDARKSRIYANRPRFSIFGVGEYSFAPWKIAISGLYKKLAFHLVGPGEGGRPVVFDDTVYFLPFVGEREARRTYALLRSELARDFFASRIFWDAKRPITAGLLRLLDVELLRVAARQT